MSRFRCDQSWHRRVSASPKNLPCVTHCSSEARTLERMTTANVHGSQSGSLHDTDVPPPVVWSWALWGWSGGLGVGVGVVGVLMGVLAPVIGQRADVAGRRKLWLALMTGALALSMALLFFVTTEAQYFWLGAGLIAAGAGFSEKAAGNYKAMMLQVSTPKKIWRISGPGWGVGYCGGCGFLRNRRRELQRNAAAGVNPEKYWPNQRTGVGDWISRGNCHAHPRHCCSKVGMVRNPAD